MHKFFSLLLLSFLFFTAAGQDTLILLSGRKLIVKSVDLKDYTIAYRKPGEKSKLSKIDPEKVFSIKYRDGNERIIYMPDTLDPLDFKVEEMRNFIYGEQDAKMVYKTGLVKASGFVVGAGSALGAFYGLIGPPLYSTILGSFSPKIERQLSYRVRGDAAGKFGIPEGRIMNIASGTTINTTMEAGSELEIEGKLYRFPNSTSIDSLVSVINRDFKKHRVHASGDGGKLTLCRTNHPDLVDNNPYREGYEKKIRDLKIRNAMLSGLIGFVIGGIGFTIYGNNIK
jgi:hypothetical protein